MNDNLVQIEDAGFSAGERNLRADQCPHIFAKSKFFTRNAEQIRDAAKEYANSGERLRMETWMRGWLRARKSRSGE